MLEINNHLQDRALIEIEGQDRKKFLQGLITNDINKVNGNKLIYSAMLNANGRFLYDFFIFEKEDTLFLDCLDTRCDEIIQKLNLYKLRSQVKISKNNSLQVIHNLNNGQFIDPRHPKLGFRSYQTDIANCNDSSAYHAQRISLKIAESEYDLTYDKSFILEFGFDHLNAIDYQKGCYVGQELTARTHYRGQIRKKIFAITIEDFNNKNNLESLKNSKITCQGKNLGIILSHIITNNKLRALALLKIEQEQNPEILPQNLEFDNQKIVIIN